MTTLTKSIAKSIFLEGDQFFNKMLAINFKDGANGVERDMKLLMKSHPSSIIPKLCEGLNFIFLGLIRIFSIIISTFIPDDAGIASIAIEVAVTLVYTVGTMASFFLLKQIYNNLVPKFAKNLLQSPKKLEEFMRWIVKFLREKIIDQKSMVNRVAIGVAIETLLNIVFGTGLLVSLVIPPVGFMLIPPIILTKTALSTINAANTVGIGRDQILTLIDILEDQIPTMVKLIQMVMPLTYATAYIIASC